MIKDMLLKLPEEIKAKRKSLVETSLSIENINAEIREWEAEQMEDIANAMRDGKPAFSNAEKRAAELARRKKDDSGMIQLEAQLNFLKSGYETDRINLQYSIDIQENYRAIARLGGGEV